MEHVGPNMGIQIPLLVIDRRGVSVMSAWSKEIPVVYLYTQSTPTVSGSCTISWSKEMILDIRKALAYELHDLVICLGLGLVHHIILLMM